MSIIMVFAIVWTTERVQMSPRKLEVITFSLKIVSLDKVFAGRETALLSINCFVVLVWFVYISCRVRTRSTRTETRRSKRRS